MKSSIQYKTIRYYLTPGLLIIVFLLFAALRSCVKPSPDAQEPSYDLISGGKESCMVCHEQFKGFSQHHDPRNIGCAVCHLGHPEAIDKDSAHASMVRIPGNLEDAGQTCGTCHPSELQKIENSLMTTNSGLVAVDKFVFDETNSPDGHYDIRKIGQSAADQHLRNLCANCHLGSEKEAYGPITELSRGGGCNACHLNYTEEAKNDLASYIESGNGKLPFFHPSTDIRVGDEHCFGCHSRSSRISTNYMGWQETLLGEIQIGSDSLHRSFMDGRVYKKQPEDVHHASGMLCVDCHGVKEVMGDGKKYSHEEQAVQLSCGDCHFSQEPDTTGFTSLDRESLLVFSHRGFEHVDKPMLRRSKDSGALVNTYVDEGRAYLIGKQDKKIREIQQQPEACARDAAHQSLTCSSCHSQWAPRCIGCHNSFEQNDPMAYDLLGKKVAESGWVEHVFEFSADLPALGVREHKEMRQIEPAVPGMILTIDHDSFEGDSLEGIVFKRLYAPNAPHTIGKKVRNCVSCHANSSALGYGKGHLELVGSGSKITWSFVPEYAASEYDGLPEDAWIPFLGMPLAQEFSTRSDFRPFSTVEQQRILEVGACLQCHEPDSELMTRSLSTGINPLLLEMTEQCKMPNFEESRLKHQK